MRLFKRAGSHDQDHCHVKKHVLVKQLKKVLETEWYHNQMLPSEYIASKMTMDLT